jgi:hypothetical protein
MNTSEDPGYLESDVDAAIGDDRMLAAIDVYARDQIPMKRVLAWVAGDGRAAAFPDRLGLNMVALARLIHEVAKRIRSGEIQVPPRVAQGFADFYATKEGELDPEEAGIGAFKFSGFENFPPLKHPLGVRRQSFDEEDVQALVNDGYMLACFDAFRQNIIDIFEAQRRMFGSILEYQLPRNLSFWAFRWLAQEVADRIDGNRVTLPAGLRSIHPSAYAAPIVEPEEKE